MFRCNLHHLQGDAAICIFKTQSPYEWLQSSENGANCTETRRGNNTVTVDVELKCNCWKIKMYEETRFLRNNLQDYTVL